MSVSGIITDIHRTSVVDGPGLRTTVFLKGCPLRCIWCHNPETQQFPIEPAFEWEKASDADFKAFGGESFERKSFDGDQIAGTQFILERVNEEGLKSCLTKSSTGALSVYGRRVSVDDVLREVVKDKDYYDNSGGGLTVSGGEPMSQPEFTLELLRKAKELGIHTVLDTTGWMSREKCEATLAVTDLYLFDYKASDDAKHRELTGVGLDRIVENLDFLASRGANLFLRCPIIPGVNDDVEHLKRIIDLKQKYSNSINKVDLLTWHTMGEAKYARLGRMVSDVLPKSNVSDQGKQHYRSFLESEGLTDFEVF